MVTAYPVANKAKSLEICKAFVDGCGGRIAKTLQDGPAFFYGVDASNLAIWREVVRRGIDYYYSDNSYFDESRQLYFRVTKNRLQHRGIGPSSGERFTRLGIRLHPWQHGGRRIIVCPQSDAFMQNVVGSNADWMPRAIATLEQLTKRAIVVRPWSSDKARLAGTLVDDLVDAYALVTWSSAAAITAVIRGVPVVTLGQCAAEPMAGSLNKIESLPRPANRLAWASVLADNQWTLDEFRHGIAWSHLNEAENP